MLNYLDRMENNVLLAVHSAWAHSGQCTRSETTMFKAGPKCLPMAAVSLQVIWRSGMEGSVHDGGGPGIVVWHFHPWNDSWPGSGGGRWWWKGRQEGRCCTDPAFGANHCIGLLA